MEKPCSKCGERKPLSEYHRNRAAPDGKRAECKSCTQIRTRAYYAEKVAPRFNAGPASGVCAHCKAGFEYVKSTGSPRKYCSERCKYLGGDQLKRDRAPEHVRQCSCGSADVKPIGKPVCMACRKDKRDPLKAAARERRRNLRLYNLTEDDFDRMLAAQGGRCAICRTADSGPKRWHIDHDHRCCPGYGSCGQCVRGLLCHSCNLAIGYLADDPVRMRAAIEYLERTVQRPIT